MRPILLCLLLSLVGTACHAQHPLSALQAGEQALQAGNPQEALRQFDLALRQQPHLERALALCFIGLKSEGMSRAQLAEIDKAYHISSKLSPIERAYVTVLHPTEKQRTNANWRYEELHVLLWALGYVPTLAYPDHLCEIAPDVKIIHNLSETQFRARVKLRSKKELLDHADLILRLD